MQEHENFPAELLKTIKPNELQILYDKALAEDKNYNLKDAAKFRATEQKVQTYEEWKAIVDAAHLEPIKKCSSKKKTLFEMIEEKERQDEIQKGSQIWCPISDELKRSNN